MLGDEEERDEKAPPPTPLDCSWIVKHYSDELVIVTAHAMMADGYWALSP
jgi:hypothetical protein